MVQYIPRQNTGESLSQGIGQEAERFASIIGGIEERKNQQKAMQSENEALKQMGIDLSGISNPETRKLIISEKLKGQTAEKKNAGNEKELEQIKQTAQKSFDTAAELLNKGDIGLGSGIKGKIFGGEAAHDTGKFQSAMGGLESILVDMVSRGTLSNARFKYITETLLPSPSDRDQVIKGKLEALADLLGLDPSSLTGRTPGINPSAGNKKETASSKEKAKFNPKNKDHIAKMKQLEKQFKGDKAKVNEALAREFE